MIQVSLIGYAAGGAFLGLGYFDLPYHLIIILVLAAEFSGVLGKAPQNVEKGVDESPLHPTAAREKTSAWQRK